MTDAYTPAEQVIRDYLDARFPGARVVTERPADLADQLPCIVVGGIGGSDDVPSIDDTVFDVDYFDADRITARDGAEDVRSALRFELPGQTIDGVFVLRVGTVVRPIFVPYDNTEIRRFVGTYSTRLHHTI